MSETLTLRCPKCGGPAERWDQPGRITPATRCITNGCTWNEVTPLTLPWAVLAHDNHRFIPRRGGKGLIAAPGYREAKRQAATLLTLRWKGPTYSRPVELVARAYVPDARKRDVGNYRKLITDALTGIAYTDDSLVHREVWERAGIDRVNPRIELTISPL